jgi:regulator of replication initiation timing
MKYRQPTKKERKMCQEVGHIGIELRAALKKNEELQKENVELKERLNAMTENFRKKAKTLRAAIGKRTLIPNLYRRGGFGQRADEY